MRISEHERIDLKRWIVDLIQTDSDDPVAGSMVVALSTRWQERREEDSLLNVWEATPEERSRFEEKIERGEDVESCWQWTGGKTGKGYGNFKFRDEMIGAHRMSYMIYRGTITPGMEIRHMCHDRGCVNPSHLLIGTAIDNQFDNSAAGTAWKENKYEEQPTLGQRTDELKNNMEAVEDKIAPEELWNQVWGEVPLGSPREH